MWKVLIYDIERDKKRERKFYSEDAANDYANSLKLAHLNKASPDAIFVDVVPV